MSTLDQISELLLRWEELRDEGRAVPVEELCRDYPDLTDAVRQRIQALEAVYRVPNGRGPLPETRDDEAGRSLFPRGNLQIPGYEILGVLGHGGMGIVYQARHLTLRREVALKMILTGPHASPRDIQRFRTEAEMVAQLQHPNIVQIYEVGEQDGQPYLALELVSGGSLAERLEGQPIPAHQAAELVETLARATHYAHQHGIVHRDLKPANILISAESQDSPPSSLSTQHSALSTLIPKITDFGLAKRFDTKGQTQTGAVLGTPSYMAPEQAAGKTRAIGPATDVYALGAILYEALTGRPPFQGASPLEIIVQISADDPPAPRTLNSRLDRDLETICLKCLEKEPQRRYASAEELADDLRRYQSGELIRARGFTLVDRMARTLNRSELVTQFHALGTLMCWIAVVPLTIQVTGFVLWHRTASYDVAIVLTTLTTLSLIFVLMAWTAWRRGLFDSTQVTRHFWSIRIGHLLGMLLIPVLSWQLAAPESHWSLLTVFPYWAAITGVTFFPLGSNFWGRLYLFGLIFFAAAPVMALRLEWAPLELGVLVTVLLLALGSHMRRIEREFRQNAET